MKTLAAFTLLGFIAGCTAAKPPQERAAFSGRPVDAQQSAQSTTPGSAIDPGFATKTPNPSGDPKFGIKAPDKSIDPGFPLTAAASAPAK
jgi:hypothetical protein